MSEYFGALGVGLTAHGMVCLGPLKFSRNGLKKEKGGGLGKLLVSGSLALEGCLCPQSMLVEGGFCQVLAFCLVSLAGKS